MMNNLYSRFAEHLIRESKSGHLHWITINQFQRGIGKTETITNLFFTSEFRDLISSDCFFLRTPELIVALIHERICSGKDSSIFENRHVYVFKDQFSTLYRLPLEKPTIDTLFEVARTSCDPHLIERSALSPQEELILSYLDNHSSQ